MKRKIFDVVLSVTAGGLLLALGAGVIFLPKEDFSEEENRMLATLSAPTLSELADGSFFADIGDFYRDRLPLRSTFVATKACAELALFKGENNGVLFCKDGYLLQKGEYDTLDIARKNLAYLYEIEDECRKAGVPFVCALAPRGIDVMTHALPTGYAGVRSEVWRLAESSELAYTDLTPALRRAAESGEYVWYRTDHHWTARGAYVAYTELSKALGYTPHDESFFSVTEVSDSFLGSIYSTAGCLAPRADSVELYRYAGDGDYTVTADGRTFDSLYFTERLSEKDKYSVYLGGNYSSLTVTRKSGEVRQRLLVIKDSYANSLVPLLALHYDLELVDLRYFEGGYDALCERIADADRVLLLHGIDTVATTGLR